MHWLLPVVAVACIASLCAFVAMGSDKRRAVRKARRIPERMLAAWAILGGWPGLVAGGLVFRHKTQATAFKMKATMAAVIHAACVAVAWRSLA